MSARTNKRRNRARTPENFRGPIMKAKLTLATKAVSIIALVVFIAVGVINLHKSEHTIKLQKVELQDRTTELKKLDVKFNQLDQSLKSELQQKDQNQQKIKELEDQKTQLEQEKSKLEADLQAKAARKATEQVAATKAQSVVVGTSYASGDSDKMFIYANESGNVPCKINGGAVDCGYDGIRACGLGQALPCQKLTAVCALSNYDCQDKWFTSYMLSRYGSWAAARSFWVAHRWW